MYIAMGIIILCMQRAIEFESSMLLQELDVTEHDGTQKVALLRS